METRLGGDYRRKIKTVDELYSVLGPRPREHTVVMCHGVFDLVHPGTSGICFMPRKRPTF